MNAPVAEDIPRILVVDDERVIREILADFLSLEGFSVRTAADGTAALMELSRGDYDLVLSDLKMPNMGGLELLEAIKQHTPNVITVIMTGFGTVETAIEAMKRGAYDYILKPFKVEEVVHTIRRGLEKQKLQAENLRLRETLSLFKVSEAIAASLSLEEVLHTLVRAAIDEMDADLVVVSFENGEGGYFERAREVHPKFRPQGGLGLVDPATLQLHFAEDPVLRVHGKQGAKYFREQPEADHLQSFLATRLAMRDRTLGFLCAASFTVGRRFDEGQRKLLRMLADRASAAIENARLYENLQATFRQTIKGLASAIDKMDRYTAGHSERVAAYAQILAIKLGLSEEMVEVIRQSAMMHDVGKIGCVMNLNKPGKLSQEEYDVFKKHPGFGRDILEPITFLHPLIPGVHLHHERWDGHGYPLGMKGQEIPLIARIISVADTYDAMTSDRAYRKALPHEVAAQEIQRCSASQFDPDIATEFNRAIEADRREKRDVGIIIPE